VSGDLQRFGGSLDARPPKAGRSPDSCGVATSSAFASSSAETWRSPAHISASEHSYAAAAARYPRPGVVDQIRRIRRAAIEKWARSCHWTPDIDQAQVRLVDEGVCLQRVFYTLAPHVPARQAEQFVVHEIDQRLERGLIAVLPREQQSRHPSR
jgi:hypothetical protein